MSEAKIMNSDKKVLQILLVFHALKNHILHGSLKEFFHLKLSHICKFIEDGYKVL